MTTTVPAGYNVTNFVSGADYNSGPGTGSAVNFHCSDTPPVSVNWYFTPICDANAWGGWGICSTSCGGGYQTRVNQCGTSQSQACNTQACTWWQVKDADVSTNGDLRSMIPVGNYFGLIGAGGYPGIPAYTGGTNLTPSNVSVTAQMANTQSVGAKVYSYKYFANLIPATTVVNTVPTNTFDQSAVNLGTTDPETGYYWYKYDGSLHSNLALTTSALSMGSKKVILMVNNADLDIAGNINLTKGAGFVMAIVKGNIVVAPGLGGLVKTN